MSLSTFGKDEDGEKEKSQLPYDFLTQNIVRPAEAILYADNRHRDSESDTE